MSSKKPTSHLLGRSAITGRFKPVAEARRQPATSVVERVPNPGHGDTGRSGGRKK